MSRIKVNFEGKQKRISHDDAERQSRTMRQILGKLRTQPGVFLCDEVGMGKTYVALGVAAQYLMNYPRSRVLIITPSADLAEKWRKDLERFCAENVSENIRRALGPQPRAIRHPIDMLGAKDKSRIWVLPISIFFQSRRQGEQKEFRRINYHLISRAARLSRSDRKVLWQLLGGSARSVPRPRKRLYWNKWRIPSFRNRVAALLKKKSPYGFDPANVSDSALQEMCDDVRWLLIKTRLRRFSLIVADEAHHFRSPGTMRYRSLKGVFKDAFRNILFLTATPFQLGPDELENIMGLFRLSSERSARGIENEAKQVTDCARQYKDSVEKFEHAWQQLSDVERQIVCEEGQAITVGIRVFGEAYEHLQSTHKALQITLSKWLIRNIKDRPYRQSNEGAISLSPTDQLPFSIMNRLIYEYQRRKRTFSATQNVSLTSSWEAFRNSAIMRGTGDGTTGVTFYRKAMKTLVNDDDVEHPKFKGLVAIVRSAFQADEKVLVFTSRIKTVRVLQLMLERVIQEEIFGKIDLPRRDVILRLRQIRKRAIAPRDSLWLVFHENYFRSYLSRIPPAEAVYPDIVRGMYRFLKSKRIGLIGSAKNPNWAMLTYLCEWMIFKNPAKFAPKDVNSPLVRYWRANLPAQVNVNIKPRRKLTANTELEVLRHHSCSAVQLKEWISRILDHRSLWDGYVKDTILFADLDIREKLLDSIARVLLVPEVIGQAIRSLSKLGRGQTEKAVIRAFEMPIIKNRVARFLKEMRTRPIMEVEAYTDGMETENMVSRASGAESTNDRLRHRYGFNTPFRPYILIASDIMQEGLDLHRECARIVHYDLDWNPAKLEQRVGRIDRLGSRVEKQLRINKDAKLNIHRNYIPGTIDERMFKVVRSRERWFKFILGHKPEWETDTEDRVESITLPEKYGTEFRIQLGTG